VTDTVQRGARSRRSAPPPSLRELALEEIRLAITTGQLDEGRTYSAAGLAKELGMSLSPVREAMMSLVSEGTVEAVPNRGFRLRHVSLADLEEIIRIRVILSMPAVEDLCRRARAAAAGGAEAGTVGAELDELDRLATEGTAAVAAGAYEEFLRLDRDFHRSLLRFGLGPRAAEVSIRLRDQSRLVDDGRPVALADEQTAAELVEIVALLRAGRTDDARRAVRDNLHCYERILGEARAERSSDDSGRTPT
jgi:DNA-binding GntR family transcriptional regulator